MPSRPGENFMWHNSIQNADKLSHALPWEQRRLMHVRYASKFFETKYNNLTKKITITKNTTKQNSSTVIIHYNILRDRPDALSSNFLHSVITMWKTHELVICELYSLEILEFWVIIDSEEIETFVKVLYLWNNKEQDGSSRTVWLRFLLLMIMNHWMLASEIWSRGKL
jgi:hypothetical protein